MVGIFTGSILVSAYLLTSSTVSEDINVLGIDLFMLRKGRKCSHPAGGLACLARIGFTAHATKSNTLEPKTGVAHFEAANSPSLVTCPCFCIVDINSWVFVLILAENALYAGVSIGSGVIDGAAACTYLSL